MTRPIGLATVTVTVLVAVTLQVPALAGTLTGTASYRERIALPPDAVFEAVLIDAAIADAPARELGRVRLQPAGQPPFRFSIPYRDRDVRPGGRYTVRATVRQGARLLFTTDTFTPVLTGGPPQPLNLLMVAMEGDYRRLEQAYLKAQPSAGAGRPLLVNLEGLIANRPSAEPGLGPQRTLVVERFVGVHPGKTCPQPLHTSMKAGHR